jgi:mono/diheme cytochrome c family protein
MRWKAVPPLVLFAVVTAATVGLALWHPFTPSASTAPAAGNSARGESVFATNCAGCHGAEGAGA